MCYVKSETKSPDIQAHQHWKGVRVFSCVCVLPSETGNERLNELITHDASSPNRFLVYIASFSISLAFLTPSQPNGTEHKNQQHIQHTHTHTQFSGWPRISMFRLIWAFGMRKNHFSKWQHCTRTHTHRLDVDVDPLKRAMFIIHDNA